MIQMHQDLALKQIAEQNKAILTDRKEENLDNLSALYIDTCKLQDTIFQQTGVEFEDYEESLRYFG